MTEVTLFGAIEAIQKILESLPDEEARKEVLAFALKNRCKKCFDYDPSGNFWCCYDSRGN